jgi:hypothetical protein
MIRERHYTYPASFGRELGRRACRGRRRPGTRVGDPGPVEHGNGLEQSFRPEIADVVVGQRREIHTGDPEGLDRAWLGSEVERLGLGAEPAVRLRRERALQVHEKEVG